MAAKLPYSEEDLRRAAGPMSYARGLGYLERVASLEVAATWVAATVVGNDVYQVRLSFGDTERGVRGDCSCPFGAEGNFCKHCVATGLAALKRGDFQPARTESTPAPGAEPGALVSWLSSLSRDELLTELLELLVDEPGLTQRFELRAAGQQLDVEAVGDTVRSLIQVSNVIDYDEAGEYANDVTRAADAIAELVDAGAASQAIDLVRDAIELVRQSFEMADDSNGEIGSAAYELLDVHLLACQAASPDPVELAIYLAELCLTDQYGLLPAFADYAELLGDAGRTALRERVAAAYSAHPDDFHVRSVMESVIEAEGDIDALVALYAAHLDQRGWQHWRIAQKLDEADRADEALGWAERGVRAGPRPDDRLVDYLAGRYAAAGRMDDLLEMRRVLFAAERTLANFRALRRAAMESEAWSAEREAAFSLLRRDAAAVQGRTLWFPWAGPVLIDALIDDGDLAAAWAAAADIASQPQWIRLADVSASEYPAEARAVYVKVIERLTQDTGDAVYQQIATHLLAARACHEAMGTMDEFRQYMVLLRMAQKRKRNLMKLLDEKGL